MRNVSSFALEQIDEEQSYETQYTERDKLDEQQWDYQKDSLRQAYPMVAFEDYYQFYSGLSTSSESPISSLSPSSPDVLRQGCEIELKKKYLLLKYRQSPQKKEKKFMFQNQLRNKLSKSQKQASTQNLQSCGESNSCKIFRLKSLIQILNFPS